MKRRACRLAHFLLTMSRLTSSAAALKVGSRVSVGGARGSNFGTVRFIGTTQFATGEWIGVDLGKPEGKNDGSVNDVRCVIHTVMGQASSIMAPRICPFKKPDAIAGTLNAGTNADSL